MAETGHLVHTMYSNAFRNKHVHKPYADFTVIRHCACKNSKIWVSGVDAGEELS